MSYFLNLCQKHLFLYVRYHNFFFHKLKSTSSSFSLNSPISSYYREKKLFISYFIVDAQNSCILFLYNYIINVLCTERLIVMDETLLELGWLVNMALHWRRNYRTWQDRSVLETRHCSLKHHLRVIDLVKRYLLVLFLPSVGSLRVSTGVAIPRY